MPVWVSEGPWRPAHTFLQGPYKESCGKPALGVLPITQGRKSLEQGAHTCNCHLPACSAALWKMVPRQPWWPLPATTLKENILKLWWVMPSSLYLPSYVGQAWCADGSPLNLSAEGMSHLLPRFPHSTPENGICASATGMRFVKGLPLEINISSHRYRSLEWEVLWEFEGPWRNEECYVCVVCAHSTRHFIV